MARNRWINTAKWDDSWHRSIGIVGRGFFDYLMTNSLTNLVGIYPITLPRMAFDTGIDESELKKLLAKFAEDGKVFYEFASGEMWIIMPNWIKHQELNPNMKKSVEKYVNEPPESLRKLLLEPKSKCYVKALCDGSKGFERVTDLTLSYSIIFILNAPPARGDNKSYPQDNKNGSSSFSKRLSREKGMS